MEGVSRFSGCRRFGMTESRRIVCSLSPCKVRGSRTRRANGENSPQSTPRPWDTLFFFITLTAFLLRLAVIMIGHTYRITPAGTTFSLDGRWAGSPGRSRWTRLHSPTDLPTGPSAWAPPVYPTSWQEFSSCLYLQPLSAGHLYFQQHLLALTCLIYTDRSKRFTEYSGASHGLDLGMFPYAVYGRYGSVWEQSLSAFLLSWACGSR